MKTQFIITADTDLMKVTLVVKQGKIQWRKDFRTVTDACTSILHGIDAVQQKQGKK